MIDIQHEEFLCSQFIHGVFVVMAISTALLKEIDRPDIDVTSDWLMRLHFNELQKPLNMMLDDPELIAAFTRLYPTRLALLTIASDQIESLKRLQSVRNALLIPHVADADDVHNYHADLFEHPPEMLKADLADMHGLTIDQLDTWVDQVDPKGYVHLGAAELQQMRDAITAEHPPTTAVNG